MKRALSISFGLFAVVGACRSEESASVAPPPEDAAAETAPADAAPERALGCPGETPATYAWAPPVPKEPKACTDDDLRRLANLTATNTSPSSAEMAEALGPACAKCAIGAVGDPQWRAVVVGHEAYIGNVGGCAVRLGATEPCGKEIDALSTCLIVGCAGCKDRKAQDTCADMLTTVDGACAAHLRTMRRICNANILASAFDTNGECQSFAETIRLFCG